ncbi:hypothetical protein [Streptomyces sp. NPDC048636]
MQQGKELRLDLAAFDGAVEERSPTWKRSSSGSTHAVTYRHEAHIAGPTE